MSPLQQKATSGSMEEKGRVFRLLESGAVGDKGLRDLSLPDSLFSRIADINITHLLQVLQERHEGTVPNGGAGAPGGPLQAEGPPGGGPLQGEGAPVGGPQKAEGAPGGPPQTPEERSERMQQEHQEKLRAAAMRAVEEIERGGG
ncbi:uncharacterized protein EMH_0088690 [Eimeria mitis]|uniref:Uncharacterized protein n=1 Tax=Eimeria mitis TaxID=44415 RepID=U6KIA1_9EIME|nr:uncharacterized protein EMH_0088690 [Eimeria mitis]CDJ36516.1 hypothetical protein, conserved [Eimeria mitis]